MDKKKMEEYLEKFPIEIREPIMALNTDQKWALFIALTLDKEMYFNEIKKVFNGNANTIDTNLKALVASGLIAKKVKKIEDIKNQEKTYYHATEFGKNFLYILSDIGLPKIPETKSYIKNEERYTYKSVIKPEPIQNIIFDRYTAIGSKIVQYKSGYLRTSNVRGNRHIGLRKVIEV